MLSNPVRPVMWSTTCFLAYVRQYLRPAESAFLRIHFVTAIFHTLQQHNNKTMAVAGAIHAGVANARGAFVVLRRLLPTSNSSAPYRR